MKLALGIIFSLVTIGLIGAIGFFAMQGMREADRLAENKTETAQQQAEINEREAAGQQKRAALQQALKDCVAQVDKMYADNIKKAQKTMKFPTQQAADQYLKQLLDVRNTQAASCQQQYDQALQESAIEYLPN